jgi:hypothetical protein
MTEQIPEDMTELTNASIDRVDLVGKAANGHRFLLAKSGDSPAIMSPADVEALIKDADDEDPTDVDLTTVLAEPDSSAPGDENQPGSPAWEAVDAATACKWTSVLSRAKNALEVMADREGVESASPGGDDSDYGNQWDLEDAASAIDYAISILAPFAVSEAQDAELGAEAAATLIGKAADALAPALASVEGLTSIAKAGRALSAANETALRNAADAIQKVLASLPQAPDEAPLVKEAPVADKTPLTKADADVSGLEIVYTVDGKVRGVTDPANIQAVAGSAPAADAPAEEAPAEAVADDAPTDPSAETAQAPAVVEPDDGTVTKATPDIAQMLKEALEPIAKQLAAHAELADVVKGLQERIEAFGREPDDRKSPLLNGATGTAGIAKRDGTETDPLESLRKAVAEASNPGERLAAEKNLGYAAVKARLTSN